MFETFNKFRQKEIEMANQIEGMGFDIYELNDGMHEYNHDRFYASDFQMVTLDEKKVNVSFKALDGNKAQLKAFALRNLISNEIKGGSYWLENDRVKINNSFKQSQVNLFYKMAEIFNHTACIKLSDYFSQSTALWTMVKYGSQDIQQGYQPDYYIIRTKEGYRAYKDFTPIFNSIKVYKKGSANKAHEIDLEYFTKEGELKTLMLQFNIDEKMLLNQPYYELEDLFI